MRATNVGTNVGTFSPSCSVCAMKGMGALPFLSVFRFSSRSNLATKPFQLQRGVAREGEWKEERRKEVGSEKASRELE